MNRKGFLLLPTLNGPDVTFEVGGYLFPGVQPRSALRQLRVDREGRFTHLRLDPGRVILSVGRRRFQQKAGKE